MSSSSNDKIPSILIVDDELMNIKMLQAFLKKEGYRTFTANNGAEGRQVALEESPDLILLDIVMKGEDGFETCSKLKQNIATTDIPIIFISAMDDVASKVKGLNMGAVDYISKPFEREEVLARTRIHLKLSIIYRAIIEEQTAKLKQIQDAQQAIFVKPSELPEANFSVKYLPFHEAGGDFYDVIQIGEGIYGYFAADISGHDLGASFTTAVLKALLSQNSQPMYTPVETMKIMNSVLTGILTGGTHITACYAHLNRAQKRLTILSAGHPPLITISNGEGQCISAEGDILGIFDNVVYEPYQKKVSKGERFFLYTDGLLERFEGGFRNRQDGIKELMAACIKTRELPINEAVSEIQESLIPPGTKLEDDLLLMGVEV